MLSINSYTYIDFSFSFHSDEILHAYCPLHIHYIPTVRYTFESIRNIFTHISNHVSFFNLILHVSALESGVA